MIKQPFSEAFIEISIGIALILSSLCIASMAAIYILSYVGVI